ncbi:MAG: flagellar motor protein MotB, partial [Cytophagales bacterium CG18_big_fil_WC_8_21_14_2_50_42_9]
MAAKSSKKQVSGWTGNPYTKLVYAQGDSTNWSAPEAMPAPLNSEFQTGSAVFSSDQNVVFFTRINQIKKKNKAVNTDPFSWVKFSDDADYINRLEIFMSEKKNDKWTEPVPFAYNKVAEYSVGHPALSPDDNTLYFVSDMPGSLGQTDIFYCVRQANGRWGTPINAGREINTAGKEMFPTMGPNGRLYFSSEGHGGMGGLDLFAAEGSAATWKNIRNLKYPLNSSADDFGIIFDKTGDAGYLSSNRQSTDGTDDILAFKYVRIPCRLAGRTVERVQIKPGVYKETPVSKVLLRLYKEGDTTATITYSDAAGYFTFPILDGIKYTIKGFKNGYLNKSAGITPDCRSVIDMIKLDMIFNRNTLNKAIVLENIYYDKDKHHIRPDAAIELDKLVQILKDNPGIKIELSSHTD